MRPALVLWILAATVASAQEVSPISSSPTATVLPADPIHLPGLVDSNSPVVWNDLEGEIQMFVFTSVNGRPSRARGASLLDLGPAEPVELSPWPGGGVWLEAVVIDDGGSWYGYYHNEVGPVICGRETTKTYPRVGAARSDDRGATWRDLGIILEPSPGSFDCDTPNEYFVGGYGDFSVMLDGDSRDLYIFFSQYGRDPAEQGVGAARMAWADRDAPAGKVTVWSEGAWLAPRLVTRGAGIETDAPFRWDVPPASALFATQFGWHDVDGRVDAFWGPSIHFNAYLHQYVMLLNRSKDDSFSQEGIYVSFSDRLDDPAAWSPPVKVLDGGSWYPQVVGVGRLGTDKFAGRLPRFFMGGSSNHVIQFQK